MIKDNLTNNETTNLTGPEVRINSNSLGRLMILHHLTCLSSNGRRDGTVQMYPVVQFYIKM